jgi:hypothetical protein
MSDPVEAGTEGTLAAGSTLCVGTSVTTVRVPLAPCSQWVAQTWKRQAVHQPAAGYSQSNERSMAIPLIMITRRLRNHDP